MARIQMMKTLVNERLRAAAEEIFGVFERTITEYEKEIDRQRKLLDHALKPKIKLCKPDGPPLFVCEEEVPSEHQEWSPGLDQEDPEPPQIEEDPVELWTTQEAEQLQGLEEEEDEADVIKFTFTPVPVKSEHDDEKPRSSWFNQTPHKDCREAEPLPGTSAELIKTEPVAKDREASEPAGNLDPARDLEPTDVQLLISDCSETDTLDNDDDGWTETEPPLDLNALNSRTPPKGQSLSIINNFQRSMELFHGLKSPNQIPSSPFCQVCGKSYPNKKSLMSHVKVHPSDCGLCGKHLEPEENLKIHFQAHSTCSFCGKRSTSIAALERHITTHTGEKPFSCSVCSEAFRQKGYLKIHMRVHTGERPFSCTVCGKGFGQKGHLIRHWRSHVGEKTM